MTWVLAAALTLGVVGLVVLPLRTGGRREPAEMEPGLDSLNDAREQIERTLRLWYCPGCGGKIARLDLPRCPHCGTALGDAGRARS